MQRTVVGDASETALLKFTELTVGNITDYRNRFKKVVEVPFNSTNKFQVRAGSRGPERLFISYQFYLISSYLTFLSGLSCCGSEVSSCV